jgi:hypothetical protein
MTTTLRSSGQRPGVSDEAQYEEEAIARVRSELEAEFAGRVPAGTVADTVTVVHDRFRDARVREFVPLMVERRAHAKLAAIAA